jgi:uncharacterized protein (TIGR00730 family)
VLSVGVFCGSRFGARPAYLEAARDFGHALVARHFALVYGGGCVGLMGALADAVLAAHGQVVGVIPEFLRGPEVEHAGLSETVVVDDLFARKAVMIERADAFVALAGGIGTFDELLEVIAWRQLGRLRKPIALLNTSGYFDPFIALLRGAIDEGFVDHHELARLIVDREPAHLLAALGEACGT